MAGNALMDMLGQATAQQPGKGRDDDVPAMLSQGEYVIPADIVAMIGDGNSEAGFSALDQMVAQIRQNYKGSPESPQNGQAMKPTSKPMGNPMDQMMRGGSMDG